MIELRGLGKRYPLPNGEPFQVLNDVSITVPAGRITGVIGRSGAGKSTLLRCVNCLERPDEGEVWVNGQSLLPLSKAALREARANMGMVFQHVNLQARRTVFDNVAFPLTLRGESRVAIKERVMTLLDHVGLSDRVHHYPAQLSGGQKQRVSIARALATSPSVLLCDEMTSALDPETTQHILSLLLDLQHSLNLTVLLITHEMAVIRQVADDVVVMEAGCVVEQGSVLEVFQQPKAAITQTLVQSDSHVALPPAVQAVAQSGPVVSGYRLLQCTFSGNMAAQPLISECATRFGVTLNILQANLTTVHGTLMGKMCVALAVGEQADKAVSFLQDSGLMIEELGYVNQHDWHLS